MNGSGLSQRRKVAEYGGQFFAPLQLCERN